MSEPVTLLSWQTTLHPERNRTADWYWIFAFIMIAGAIASFILKDPLLGIIILLAGILLIAILIQGPAVHTIQISNRGVIIDNILYRYQNLVSFATPGTSDGHPRLVIHIRRPYAPFMSIPIPLDIDPADVRLHLRSRMHEEEDMKEPFIDRLMHTLQI